MRILVTGGAGFIGSALVRYLMNETAHSVINIDKLTYAGDLESLSGFSNNPRYTFIQADIADAVAIALAFEEHRPQAVMHLAAESHVDRSITGPGAFIQTNIVGTYTLLHHARAYWEALPPAEKAQFRFHHISTDEVYGSLEETGFFTESTPYQPRSPYSASKASSDHLVRAWHHTYDFPVLVTNCSNNYGPYQFPEKLIPLALLNAIAWKPIPVYGNGLNIRDWLYVDDHVRALLCVLEKGVIGETYNIGGNNEYTNIDVVNHICRLLDERFSDKAPHAPLITFVNDRLGHDKRYAIDSTKIQRELGWVPQETFESGLAKTIDWYLAHLPWAKRLQSRA